MFQTLSSWSEESLSPATPVSPQNSPKEIAKASFHASQALPPPCPAIKRPKNPKIQGALGHCFPPVGRWGETAQKESDKGRLGRVEGRIQEKGRAAGGR